MIKTRKDLKFYLQEDGKRNGFKKGYIDFLLHLWLGNEGAHSYRYLRVLRHCEYHTNNKGAMHRLLYYYYRIKLERLGGKYLIKISPNTAGYGLRLIHLSGGGGVRLGAKRIGNYCGFNAGVLSAQMAEKINAPLLVIMWHSVQVRKLLVA